MSEIWALLISRITLDLQPSLPAGFRLREIGDREVTGVYGLSGFVYLERCSATLLLRVS